MHALDDLRFTRDDLKTIMRQKEAWVPLNANRNIKAALGAVFVFEASFKKKFEELEPGFICESRYQLLGMDVILDDELNARVIGSTNPVHDVPDNDIIFSSKKYSDIHWGLGGFGEVQEHSLRIERQTK